MQQRISSMRDAQALVKVFSRRNRWKDVPNVDKFDHLHEELIEMSQHLRYKSEKERVAFVKKHTMIFKDGIGDLFFALCRLSNQLNIDIEEAFNMVAKDILGKYHHTKPENNQIRR
ncbi:MAG: hypothetical protein V1907_01925 [Candidatus Kerfeldbacteria bacterium]